MNDRDERRSDRALRVQSFGRENSADFAPDGKAAAQFKILDRIVADLAAARVGQRRSPVSKETLLDALALDFRDIARTARAIELDEPGFAARYRVPAHLTQSATLTHADALLDLLEDNGAPVAEGGDTPEQKAAKAALRAKFVDYETPADFVENLRADLEALRDINHAKNTDNLEGVENTAAIGTLLGQAQDVVTRLDAIVNNKYARNPDKLRAWQSASRVQRAPQRAKKAGDESAPASAGD